MLSDDEEREFQEKGFSSRISICITGRTAGRSSNIVEVGGRDARVGDVPFWRFLRLVVGLLEIDDGFLLLEDPAGGGSLADEGLFDTEGIDQAISRLRDDFKGYLGDVNPTDFIERRRGRIRLSTHRRFVSWNREALLVHGQERIRVLAARLPGRSVRVRTPEAGRATA